MTDEAPRAYTAEEVRDQLIQHCVNIARYWADQPDIDPATGTVMDTKYKCEGVVHSIFAMLDGCSMNLPAMDLVISTDPSDKQSHIDEGENWYENDMRLSFYLHEQLHRFY